MNTCPLCAATVPIGASYCPGCGTPGEVTPIGPADQGTAGPGRLGPGQLIAQRYRISGLLGRGGMGEVFRAEDLRLGQPVALKFLPDRLRNDPTALERLRAEVRVARQVSHPNVCRVHDIGEHAGRHFLTMELIDGEDLASLLRRIGRLPDAKAIEIARELCAGLQAAHAHGVIHRDLKPANVMIDGRGHARITDFGLAVSTSATTAELAGTPSHLAPELLTGGPPSASTDLYALGLVLYEVFTGRHPFDAKTFEQWRHAQMATPPTPPSELVPTLDPTLERLILACLEKDPARRPRSARAVWATLPGGDPLAAALAAGETPSPEMVAAVAAPGAMTLAQAGRAVLLLLLLAVLVAWSSGRDLFRIVPFELSPEVLADRAAAMAERLGGDALAPFREHGLTHDESFLDQMGAAADPLPPPARWQRLTSGQPAVLSFWYRQAPAPLTPVLFSPVRSRLTTGPSALTGTLVLRLDLRARLLEFQRTASLPDNARSETIDWDPWFAAAGLHRDHFEPAVPQWQPPVLAAERAAWTGRFADHDDLPLRIEAASLAGRPVWFRLIAPFERDPASAPAEVPTEILSAGILIAVLVGACVSFAAWLAVRNTRQGRGDRRGARRVGVAMFVILWIAAIAGYRGPPALGPALLELADELQHALLVATLCWLAYLALEPTLRRHGAAQLVSWSRAIAGQWRDPLIGRDVLLGAQAGLLLAAVGCLGNHVKFWTGNPYAPNHYQQIEGFEGGRHAFAVLLHSGIAGPGGLAWLFATGLLLALFRAMVRNVALAAVLTWATLAAPPVLLFMHSWPAVAVAAIHTAIAIAVFLRHGLIAALAANVFLTLASALPLCLDLDTGHASSTLAAWSMLAVLTAVAARTAIGAAGPRRTVDSHVA